MKEALSEALKNETFSYGESNGNLVAREAVAQYYKDLFNNFKPIANDVFLTNGGSMAFEVALRVLVNPGK